jgi:hypothetical protein
MQNALFDLTLESVVEGLDQSVGIRRCGNNLWRNRIRRHPGLDRAAHAVCYDAIGYA